MRLHAQSCLTLCNSTDCSPPGFSGHGILQARILEWVAISSSGGSSWPRDWTHISQAGSLPFESPGRPMLINTHSLNIPTELLKAKWNNDADFFSPLFYQRLYWSFSLLTFFPHISSKRIWVQSLKYNNISRATLARPISRDSPTK